MAKELPSIEQLLAGPAVRKLLFMAEPGLVDGLVKPHWGQALQEQAAEVMQAVPNMLEVVPAGINKWQGLQVSQGGPVLHSGSFKPGRCACSETGRLCTDSVQTVR